MTLTSQWLTKVKGNPVLPALPPWLAMPGGQQIHVAPVSGSDIGRTGKSPDHAVKTLQEAYNRAFANQNDIIFFHGEGNSAAYCTDYQLTTLTWAKDQVHLIGINAGAMYNQRSRIAWKSTAASASDIPLMTVSANGCYFSGITLAVGSADANLSFGLNVTGDRNRFDRVCIAHPQNAANDCAGAYALKLDGADECHFEDCSFGSFTTDTGTAANAVMYVDTGVSATSFRNCRFISRIEHATNSPFVRTVDALSIGFGCLWFMGCSFVATSVNGAYSQTGAMTVSHAQNDGRIIVDANCLSNATKWDNGDLNMILIVGAIKPAGDTSNLTLGV